MSNSAFTNATSDDNRDVRYLVTSGDADDGSPLCLRIQSEWSLSSSFEGVMKGHQGGESYSLYLWPYACGNLMPCRAGTAEGLPVSNISVVAPEGLDTILSPSSGRAAPAYTVQANAGAYKYYNVGTTPGGLHISVAYLPALTTLDEVKEGTSRLIELATWTEQHFGPYPYGLTLQYVTADWGPVEGGLETHPQINIAANSIGSKFAVEHEFLHAFFGNLFAYLCREDFGTLSEGLVDYVLLEFYRQKVSMDYYLAYLDAYIGEAIEAAGTSPVTMMEPTCNAISMDDIYVTTDPYYHAPLWQVEQGLRSNLDDTFQGVVAYAENVMPDSQQVQGLATVGDLIDATSVSTGLPAEPAANLWLTSNEMPTAAESDVMAEYLERQAISGKVVGPILPVLHPY